jgi:class 3 adenylate cyclase
MPEHIGLGLTPDVVVVERVMAADDRAVRSVSRTSHSDLVTLLLTDLEGSTALWDREQHAMSAALVTPPSASLQTTSRYADVIPGRRVIYQRGVERIRQAVGDDGLAQLAAARAGATYDDLVAFVRNLPVDRHGALTESPDS